MNKIIKIEGDIVKIGMNDGSLTEVRKGDLNFEPRLGDVVELYRNESGIEVILAEKTSSTQLAHQEGSGVNIHINNDNSNRGQQANIGASSGKVVNKVAYVLFAFFLGGLGAHKFYAGKVGSGIIYLIFFWTYIPAIISFVEAIIGLTKTADVNGNIVV